MKNGSFIICIFIKYLLMLKVTSQILLNQTFEQYNTGSAGISYFSFNGTWYRQDVNKSTGLFKIRGPNSTFPTKYLSVFAESASCVTCIDITLIIGNIYSLDYDYSWQWTSNFTVKWNNVTILDVQTGSQASGIFVHQTHNLPVANMIINTLCFSGYNSSTGNRLGPVVDNIVVQYLATSSNTTTSNTTNATNINMNSTNVSSPTNSINNINTTNNTNITNTTNSTNGANTVNSTNFINNMNTTRNTTNSTNQNSQNSIDSASSVSNNGLDHIEIGWIKQFSFKFNSFLKFTSFFGFSYLISNLLNFWNVIVLYYFLQLDSFLQVYRVELEKLCKISLQEGSLFSLIQKTSINLNIKIPQESYQKIPPSATNWPSFWELGFTSQIVQNNIQEYFSIFYCAFKLIILKLVVSLIKKYNNCLTPIITGVKIKTIQIFFYEIVSSAPTMITVLSVMLSYNSAIAFISFHQKINNIFQVLTLAILAIALMFPILNQYRASKLCRPMKPEVKSTILVESQQETPSSNRKKNVRFTNENTETQQIKKMTKKRKNSMIYQRKLYNYKKQCLYEQFIYWTYAIQIFDKILFFTIPFLVGLQNIQLFLVINLFTILIILVIGLKKNHVIRSFNPKQFWFGLAIKIIFLAIHLLFVVLYFQNIKLINLSITQVGLINFFIIFAIILGALVQMTHSFFNLIKWLYEIIKKIKYLKSTKVTNSENQTLSTLKKNLQLIHARKDTQAELNNKQPQSPKEEEIKSKRSIILRSIGRKTQIISTVVFEATGSEKLEKK